MPEYPVFDGDTIAAMATAPGEAGVGIVKLSGPQSKTIAQRIFIPANAAIKTLVPRRMTYGIIKDPDTGAFIDEALVCYMPAPRTHTCEDIVEINCHGGMVPLRRVLELCLKQGSRLAQPGEFTRRAFLNGRIDLAQAEASLDIIRAKTSEAESAAMMQLRGALSGKVNSIKDGVAGMLALIEAQIDFPDEDIEPASLQSLKTGLGKACGEIKDLMDTFQTGRLFREGLRVAIVGRPNVGKSSLLNALINQDRAIVTSMPGTTRDIIEEHINVHGVPLKIMDTAGIREAHDMAEAEGVKRSLGAIENADIVLAVVDGSAALHDEDMNVINKAASKKSLLVMNKSDIPDMVGDTNGFKMNVVRVSAKSGEGLENLKQAIFDGAATSKALFGEGVMVTNLRHKLLLEEAGSKASAALNSISVSPLEITALELRESLDALGSITGEVSTEDILNRIFSEFCIGK